MDVGFHMMLFFGKKNSYYVINDFSSICILLGFQFAACLPFVNIIKVLPTFVLEQRLMLYSGGVRLFHVLGMLMARQMEGKSLGSRAVKSVLSGCAFVE